MGSGYRFFGRGVLLCVLATALVACGGGGGGSSSGAGAGGGSGAGGGTGGSGGGNPKGSFTLSTTSVSFSGKTASTRPPNQTVTVHLNDTAPAGVGAAYKSGVTPATWLTASGTGSGADYTFTLVVNTSGLVAGTYTTTLTFGTGDASGNILQSQDVSITLTLHDGLATTNGSLVALATAGSSVQSTQVLPFTISAPAALQWTAASNASWLTGPGGTQQGGGTFNVTVDTATLASGTYTAQLLLTNIADSTDTTPVNVTLSLTKAVIGTSAQSVTLGGAAGLDPSPGSLTFSLSTGQNAYPLTITPDSTNGWLKVSGAGSTVSGADATITLDIDRSLLPVAGQYTANLYLSAQVNGENVTTLVPVTAYYDLNQVVVSSLGVAFSSFPSRQVLSRTLSVRDSYGLSGVSWTATVDSGQSWLSATPSGVTGDPLIVTADPTGLSPGQYSAHVNVTSPTNLSQLVYVGLTVGSTDPAQLDFSTVTAAAALTNPVEPWVYILNEGARDSIDVYDTNTGSKVRTITGTFTRASALAISDDGNTLYVLEPANGSNGAGDVRVLSAFDGSFQQVYPLVNRTLDPATPAVLQYARPDAHPVVISPATGEAFEVFNGNHIDLPGSGLLGQLVTAVSSDSRMLYTEETGVSSTTVYAYRLDYSNANSARLLATPMAINTGTDDLRGNGQDLAMSADGTKVYVASASPSRFDILDPATLTLTGFLAGDTFPNNAETCWNGSFAGGADDSSNLVGDIWIYDNAGTLRGQLDSGTDRLFPTRLSFSGDCTRIVTGSGSGVRIQSVP